MGAAALSQLSRLSNRRASPAVVRDKEFVLLSKAIAPCFFLRSTLPRNLPLVGRSTGVASRVGAASPGKISLWKLHPTRSAFGRAALPIKGRDEGCRYPSGESPRATASARS